ncbi:PorT family protein [Solitalea sp. MAHUQ-68]|uniref:PorT family protein n=1 Tax=Solitalea agri TaxID=2953739 RepID=A0A9X2F0B5_9SPHI|nr:porin family protein [Solitalea agri]MCO4292349.1 PorT family protein [Solitalea agri]
MKKIYLLTIALLGMASVSVAQSKARFGLKFGANFANQHATYQNVSKDGSTLTSFYLGGFVNSTIKRDFSFQPEFIISSQGAQEYINRTTVTYSTVNINIPLMFKLRAIDGLNFEAGPQLGFLLSANNRANGHSVDVTDGYNAVDLGVNLGAEYIFSSGFLLGLRYSHGLTDIVKNDVGTTTNRVILFGIGYRF